jgi:NADPH2:quinone reductase
MTMMRAWQCGTTAGRSGLRLVEQPMPEPGPGELLLKVGAAALNYSDMLMIDDRYQVRPPRPFIPGQEVAGRVVRAGAEARTAPNTLVASKVMWGGFADYALVRDDMAIPVPEGFSLAEAAALPVVYVTAMVALTECTTVKPGETVLIHAAAGGVGLAALQIARALGARIIATAGGKAKVELCRTHGADVALDYSDAGWLEALRAATGGKGADVIVDSVGGEITIESMKAIAWDGRLLIVGFSSGDIAAIPANRLLLRRASAIGVYWNHDRDAEMLARVTRRLTALCASGRVRPVVKADYRLDDLPRALDDLAGRRSVGKLVLMLGGE